jgi:hypothetical protein
MGMEKFGDSVEMQKNHGLRHSDHGDFLSYMEDTYLDYLPYQSKLPFLPYLLSNIAT